MLKVNPDYLDSSVLGGTVDTTAKVCKSTELKVDDDVIFYSGACYRGYVTDIKESNPGYNTIWISVLGVMEEEAKD